MKAGKDIVWCLKGQTPDRIPMARLAEYMQQLAVLLGQQDCLHFIKVEEGSLNVHVKADGAGTVGRITDRVKALRQDSAPPEAKRAYRRINEMVYEDGGPARLTGPAAILYFPGIKPTEKAPLSIVDYGDVVGKLYALAERDGKVSARIRPITGENYIQCIASLDVGKELRKFLFEPVRVYGRGTWIENGDAWVCDGLTVEEVWPIHSASMRNAIDALRALDIEWPDDPIKEMADLDEVDEVA